MAWKRSGSSGTIASKGKHMSRNVPLRRENHHRHGDRRGRRHRGRAALVRPLALGVLDRRVRRALQARGRMAAGGLTAGVGGAGGGGGGGGRAGFGGGGGPPRPGR